ncbi:MAG: hypothetical protein ACYS6W_01625 [Planctomycetota bacterium]|jgi:hypothetical protein
MADFTKSHGQVDEWAQVAGNAVRLGADISHTADVEILLEITIAHDSANAHANGVICIVEVSSNTTGDEDWTELTKFRSSGGTAVVGDLDQQSSGTSLYLTATTGFETDLILFFVKDGTIANSETMRTADFASNSYVAVLDTMTNTHESSANAYNICEQWIVRIPAAFNRSRVVWRNDDADCTICTRVRKALATDIE